ncbi:class I SAM-dependent methyltransferase [Pontibacter diazotrophicus]|uniref:Class I SAM-dependent methyltransferase n=1 Tax=Pontibacter diazotrophicus TaxID=1400979 RepID=A0A3D8LHY1_9BACT|nr:class I SAM-dependent methyltransferase [Pontibacter diazotrophicus]RDV17005.1 class I SAM-dependent methyltransferase [Pontibacter diazotrophicus]
MNVRLQLIELEDQKWFPHVIRQGMLDFLRFMISKLGAYKPALPLLQELLERTSQRHITDLCSGAGGGIEGVQQALSQRIGTTVRVTLTDLYPNLGAYRYLQQTSGGALDFIPEPIDATAVPESITGVRTIFSSFHHFPPPVAKAILQDAANNRSAIGVFEGASKSWLEVLVLWLFFPVVIVVVTPFIRPFKFSRLFFTYIIPLIPLGILWDGTVSLLRIYTPQMLHRMTKEINSPDYNWRTGKVGARLGKHVIYLIGYPVE